MRSGNSLHHLDDRDRILDFSLKPAEKVCPLIFKNGFQAFSGPVELEKAIHNQNDDDETTDENEMDRAYG